MISYEVYKILHILSIVVFFSASTAAFFTDLPRYMKIISGVATLFIFVAGMGLLARIGLDHGAGFPFWVWAKMAIWLVLAILLPVGAKRAPQSARLPILGVAFALLAASHYFALYRI